MTTWSCDFETTTNRDDCRVWLWGAVNIDDAEDFTYGTDIHAYLQWAFDVGGVHYFHNLKFDGFFILDHLLRNGWTAERKIRKSRKCFTSMISDTGKFYQLTISDGDGGMITVRDSLKKLPLSVSEIAPAFKLAMTKGDIDYAKPRPLGYTPTDDEIDYVRRDVTIVGQALRIQRDSGMKKLTVGADALNDYKDSYPYYTARFPTLHLDMDGDIRRAYRGGFTYVNPAYQDRIVGKGSSYDVNSLYPYIMRTRPIPYGYPRYFDGPPQHDSDMPLWIGQVAVDLRIKPGHIPMVQVKGSPFYNGIDYITETDESVTLFVTNVDWDLICEHYDVDVLYWHNGYRFAAATGMFDEYIDRWSKVKAESVGGQRVISKLLLNSLYGKFATNPDVTPRIPILEKNIVKLKRGPEEMRQPVYTAAGVFITSWARDYTIRAAQSMGDRFMYADTDSLHIAGHEPPPGLDIDPTTLGAWKHEYDFERARYVRAKCYVEELASGDRIVRVAGLPLNARGNITPETLQRGASFPGKLRPVIVPGGVVLEETSFVIQ